MTGPHILPFIPGYIPPDVDMTLVKAQVADGGVSAPVGADIAGLRQVVADAGRDGIDLKIVVIETNPPIDTPLRDIATEVGTAHPGSTVLAISPFYAGSSSPAYDRVTLEAGQDLAKTGDPVQSSKNFVSVLQTPDFPWMPFTIVLVLGVAVAAVFARVLQVRAKRPVADETPDAAAE
ncbi:MAG: Rv1476 family membrane protein [Mycobacterium sp.]